MKLTSEQQRALLREHAVCANEACDACGQVLGYLRYTRKDEPGEWCSRLCRDGDIAVAKHAASRKGRCFHCNLVLPKERRADSKFCDSTCERNARRAKESLRESLIAA